MFRCGLRHVFAVVVWAVLAWPGESSAHANVKMDAPLDGAIVMEAPGSLTFSFSEPFETSAVRVQVVGQRTGHESVPELSSADGSLVLSATLAAPLPDDSYLVSIGSVGLDGHRVQKTFAFAVGSGTTLITANGAIIRPADGTHATTTLINIATKTAGVILLPLLFVPIVMIRCWPEGLRPPAIAQFGLVAGTLVTGVTLLELTTYGPLALGESLSSASRPGSWQVTLGLPAGKLMIVRMLSVWTLVIATLRARRAFLAGHAPSTFAEVSMTIAAGLLLLSHAGISHAAATSWALLAMLLMVAHVGSVTVWLAGVLMWSLSTHSLATQSRLALLEEQSHSPGMITGSVTSSQGPWMGMLDRGPGYAPSQVVGIVPLGMVKFSRIAFSCVAIAVVTGVLLSLRLVGGGDTPWALLTLKVFFVALLLMAAAQVHHGWITGGGRAPHRAMNRELFLGATTMTLGTLLSLAG